MTYSCHHKALLWISTATMKHVQNCFEWNLKLCTFENVPSILAVVYVLLGRAVTEYRWGESCNISFMRHKFLVLTVKKRLKLMYIYRSYRKIKTGVSLFWTTLYIHVLLTYLLTYVWYQKTTRLLTVWNICGNGNSYLQVWHSSCTWRWIKGDDDIVSNAKWRASPG